MTTVERVRAFIAECALGSSVSAALGDVELHPHQRDGLARIRRLLSEHGGALLADDVGLGKTYVALAAAREAARVLVIAPASLRDAWLASATSAQVSIAFASVQSLSRGAPRARFDLVIVDEAHHLRSTRTRRFSTAIDVCREARVLLLTATPIQNRLDDLRALLSLFLGRRAWSLDAQALSAFVVRRFEDDLTGGARPALPAVAAPVSLPSIDDVDCLDRLTALPAPLPVADGGDGGVLLIYSLVRQWSSSRAALLGALRRRLGRAQAMQDALLAGRYPTAAELSAWSTDADSQQLAFPEMVVSRGTTDARELLEQVGRHTDAVRELLAWLRSAPDVDAVRAATLAMLRDRHPHERIVAFSEFTDTVSALYRALEGSGRVALLTHAGARVAGGRMTRRDLLRQFGVTGAPGAHERVDLLLTTDLLSEGVDLQAASVVVHLDLAWNPARLEQRVGRLRRIGARRDRVHVYCMSPPAAAERLLQLERRLRVKLAVAAAAVGTSGTILPAFPIGAESSERHHERIAAALTTWRRADASCEMPAVAAARSDVHGALACVNDGGRHTLLSVRAGRVTDAPEEIAEVIGHASGLGTRVDARLVASIDQSIQQWLTRRDITSVVSLPEILVGRSRRAVLRRVDTILRRTPRHVQPGLAPMMHAARTAAAATLSAGAERVLDQLASSTLDDAAWLYAMREFAQLHVDPVLAPRLVALLLLVRD